MTNEEWGPWIEHDGGGCPCVGEIVHGVIGEPCEISSTGTVTVYPVTSGEWDMHPQSGSVILGDDEWIGVGVDDESWRWENGFYPVVRYRVKKPRGLTILEGLIADLPEPVPAND